MLETSWINFFFFIFILLCFFRRIYITITVLIFLLLSIVILIIWRKFLYHICVSMIWVIEILRKNSWFMFSIHSSFGILFCHGFWDIFKKIKSQFITLDVQKLDWSTGVRKGGGVTCPPPPGFCTFNMYFIFVVTL